jgi:acyl-CoA dehydrogenase
VTASYRPRNATSTDELPFFFGPMHLPLAERAREFALDVAAPEADLHGAQMSTFEQLGDRCRALAQKLGRARLLDACVPAAFGGLILGDRREHIDVRAVCLLRETLGWGSALCEFVLGMQGLGSFPIVAAGTEAQRREYLPPVLHGESLAAFAITEPSAGSDIAAMKSTAERRGDEYVLRGRKTFISNAGIAGHYVVFAKTDPAAGSRGVSAFIVKPTDPGFVFEGALPLVTEHPVGSLRFDELVIPASRRLGREGEGFKLAIRTLDTFRTTVGAAACGMARRALEESLTRVATRQQFGKAIGENQLLQGYLAQMATDIDASRLLVYRAAHARDTGIERVSIDASMAKMFATEAAQRVVDRAVQIHGGSGVVRGGPIERLYRDVRALRIYEGTTEIHEVIIARVLAGNERARLEAEKARDGQGSDALDPEAVTTEERSPLRPPQPSSQPSSRRSGPETPRWTHSAGSAPRIHTGSSRDTSSRTTLPDTPHSKLLVASDESEEPAG